MQLILFTGDECPPCQAVEEAFTKRFKAELDNGEADICNLDTEEESQAFWAENDLPLAPTMVVVSDQKKLITILDPEELLEKTPSI